MHQSHDDHLSQMGYILLWFGVKNPFTLLQHLDIILSGPIVKSTIVISKVVAPKVVDEKSKSFKRKTVLLLKLFDKPSWGTLMQSVDHPHLQKHVHSDYRVHASICHCQICIVRIPLIAPGWRISGDRIIHRNEVHTKLLQLPRRVQLRLQN